MPRREGRFVAGSIFSYYSTAYDAPHALTTARPTLCLRPGRTTAPPARPLPVAPSIISQAYATLRKKRANELEGGDRAAVPVAGVPRSGWLAPGLTASLFRRHLAQFHHGTSTPRLLGAAAVRWAVVQIPHNVNPARNFSIMAC